MGSSSITHREWSLSTRKRCQEMLGSLVFLCHGHQARRSAETRLHSLRSHRTGNLFFFSSWGFIWQGIFMALLGSRSQTLDDSQKRGCGLFERYLKSGSYNVWRRSKQARTMLMALQCRTLEWPHNAWGRLSWGTNANQKRRAAI